MKVASRRRSNAISTHVYEVRPRKAARFSNPQQYEGQTVSVSRKITLYHGKPEIIVTSPAQISAQ